MLGRAVRWLSNIIKFGIVLFAITLLILTVQSTKTFGDLPVLNSYKLMVVLSGSMSPKFAAGDLIVIRTDNKPREYRVNDIITFKDPEAPARLITHRIIEIKFNEGIKFITKGDANTNQDSVAVPAQNVIGKLEFKIPYLGRFVAFVKSKYGLICLFILPGVLVLLVETVQIARHLAEHEKIQKERVVKPWINK